VRPGQKICTTCRLKLRDRATVEEKTKLSTTEDSEADVGTSEALNKSIKEAGCPPMKLQKVGKRDKVAYLKRKLCAETYISK